MKKFKELFKEAVIKFGPAIAGCAIIVAAATANSPCMLAYYEVEEPKGLDKFKKHI